MTQKEKLTELLEFSVLPRKEFYSAGEIADFMLDCGVVLFPCNVGDKLYFVEGKTIYEATVTRVESNLFTEPHEWITYRYNARFLGLVEEKKRIDLLRKENVFLTRECAEDALRERGN